MAGAALPVFTLGDLLNLLCQKSGKKLVNLDCIEYERFEKYLNLPLLHFLRRYGIFALDVQNFAEIPFIVKVETKATRKNRKHVLLFDGLHLQGHFRKSFFPKKVGLFYILLNQHSQVLLAAAEQQQHAHQIQHQLKSELLYDLVKDLLPAGESNRPNPNSLLETLAWLKTLKLEETIELDYVFQMNRGTYKIVEWSGTNPKIRKRTILVFRGNEDCGNRLHFSKPPDRQPLSISEAKKRKRMEDKIAAALLELQRKPDVQDNDPQYNNRSSSVTVSLEGFTHGVKMGLLTKTEAEAAVKQLSSLVFIIWLHFDCNQNVRHVCLKNGLSGQVTWYEMFPDNDKDSDTKAQKKEDKNWLSWKKLFDHIWQEKENMTEQKKAIIESTLLCKINSAATAAPGAASTSSLSKTRASLKQYAERTKVILFAKGDHVLHGLKMWFAHYMFTREGKKFTGVTLKTINQNNLVCLQTKSLDIANIGYLFCEASKSSPLHHLWEDQGVDLLRLTSEWTTATDNVNLPFAPLIDSNINDLKHQAQAYSPGKVSGYGSGSLTEVVKTRGRILTAATLLIYKALCEHLFVKFTVDLPTCRFSSLASLSFKCIWLSYYEKGGPMCQGLEKTKPFYDREIRKHCKGGFSYSFVDKLDTGDLLYPTVEGSTATLQSIAEYDLTSAYGFSASQMHCPTGFCVGFSNLNAAADPCRLYRTDKMIRANSFEYQGVMKTILTIMNDPNTLQIESVFSNYSPLGLFWINNYPLDLAVVFTGLRNNAEVTELTYLIQFDGRFAHGCRKRERCTPSLKRYCDDKSEGVLIEKTKQRDTSIQSWIDLQTHRQYKYFVISDCHSPFFQIKQLANSFKSTPELNKLQEPYQSLKRYSVSLDEIFNCHPDLTYLLIGSGKIPQHILLPEEFKINAFMIWKKQTDVKNVQDLGWETLESALFTRDTLEYAIKELGFELDYVSSCYFYRRCPTMSLVFEDLLDERMKCSSSSKNKLLKSIINYATGMFGFNPFNQKQENKLPAKIRNKLPKGTMAGQYNISFTEPLCNQNYFVSKPTGTHFSHKSKAQQQQRQQDRQHKSKPINSALPLYPCIVEYGKMRLLQCWRFIQYCTNPDMTKLTYSQVDNLVLALGSRSLEKTVDPAKKEFFETYKHLYLTSTNQPGRLKKEWSFPVDDDDDDTEENSQWKFVSPFPCCYAIIPEQSQNKEGQAKMSSLNGISTVQSYNISLRMLLRQPVKVMQERRVNQVANRETKMVELTMGAGNRGGGGHVHKKIKSE